MNMNNPQVVKEERRLARDKAAYSRIRQAFAQSKRPTATTPAGLGLAALGNGSDVSSRRAAAGAVAAAARELRPVELVGIYESQKEAMEKELAAAKAEVGWVVQLLLQPVLTILLQTLIQTLLPD